MLANLIYLIALVIAAPMIVFRRVRYGRYRRGVFQKLVGLSASRAAELRGDSTIWMHAVSVGEVNLLVGLVRRFEVENRDCRVVVSTSTDAGYDLAVERFGSDRVFFCPLDFSWAVKRTLRNLAPEQLVLAELELWPNLIRLARHSGCTVSVFNARLSETSAGRYRQLGWLTRTAFEQLCWVGCQEPLTAQRFVECGAPADRIEVTGSLKFDQAPTSRDSVGVTARSQWAGIDPWLRVWIVGSTSVGEERMALRVYQTLRDQYSDLRLILVPRHPERFDEVAEMIRESHLIPHRRSRDSSLFDSQWTPEKVILIDTIGELREWWGVGQIATVGGSFGNRGGQNMIEPAGYGSAVSFGPDTRNFRHVAELLLARGGAVRVMDERELKAFVERCLADIPAADALGRAAREIVRSQQGALKTTVTALTRLRQPTAAPVTAGLQPTAGLRPTAGIRRVA